MKQGPRQARHLPRRQRPPPCCRNRIAWDPSIAPGSPERDVPAHMYCVHAGIRGCTPKSRLKHETTTTGAHVCGLISARTTGKPRSCPREPEDRGRYVHGRMDVFVCSFITVPAGPMSQGCGRGRGGGGQRTCAEGHGEPWTLARNCGVRCRWRGLRVPSPLRGPSCPTTPPISAVLRKLPS